MHKTLHPHTCDHSEVLHTLVVWSPTTNAHTALALEQHILTCQTLAGQISATLIQDGSIIILE